MGLLSTTLGSFKIGFWVVVTGFTREIGTIGYSVVAGLGGDACC
jgi:hypothetical protein